MMHKNNLIQLILKLRHLEKENKMEQKICKENKEIKIADDIPLSIVSFELLLLCFSIKEIYQIKMI